jgi:demethylmenaquinone methyltransferase / 2-methoxy-6-polyprenyl-1,4-benzoquinol methylase
MPSCSGQNTETAPVDKSAPRIRTMFGQIARRYDLLNHLLSLGIDRHWRRKTTQIVPPKVASGNAAAPVLDICCGTADLTLAFLKASGNKTPVVGADFCYPMLEIGQKKVDRLGFGDKISLVEADGLELPFAANQFQIVSVAFGLRNMADTDRALSEMVRVAGPGGRIAILEFSMPQGRVLGPLYRWYFHSILPRVGQAVAKNRFSAYNYLSKSVVQFPQGEAMLGRMRAAGMKSACQYQFTFGIVTLYVGEK